MAKKPEPVAVADDDPTIAADLQAIAELTATIRQQEADLAGTRDERREVILRLRDGRSVDGGERRKVSAQAIADACGITVDAVYATLRVAR